MFKEGFLLKVLMVGFGDVGSISYVKYGMATREPDTPFCRSLPKLICRCAVPSQSVF